MVGYHQTNQKTDTGKTLTRRPVLVDHNRLPEGSRGRLAVAVAGDHPAAVQVTMTLVNDTGGNDSNLLIVFYVQIMPDDFVMQLHRF